MYAGLKKISLSMHHATQRMWKIHGRAKIRFIWWKYASRLWEITAAEPLYCFSAHLPLIQIRWQDTSRIWVTLEAHQTLLKIDLHTRSHVSRNFTAIYMQQQHINSALIISQNEALCMFVIQQQDGIKFNNGQRVCIINKNFASIRVAVVSLAV